MTAEFIDITVATTGGDLTDRFNVQEPIRVLFNRALALVGGGVDRGAFALEYEDTELDLERSIADYIAQLGWTDGVALELVPSLVVI